MALGGVAVVAAALVAVGAAAGASVAAAAAVVLQMLLLCPKQVAAVGVRTIMSHKAPLEHKPSPAHCAPKEAALHFAESDRNAEHPLLRLVLRRLCAGW